MPNTNTQAFYEIGKCLCNGLEKIIPDDAKNSTVSYTIHTCSKQHLRNTKREDLTESTGVVPAKYPPNVKLEFLTTLECQSGYIMRTLVNEGIWAFIVKRG